MKSTIVGLACAALLFGAAVPARADTILITDGLISTDFVHAVNIDLVSSLFDLNLLGSATAVNMPAAGEFHAGQRVDFSATVNGVFSVNMSPLMGPTVSVNFNLIAAPIAAPFGTFTTHTPFIMTGTVQTTDVVGAGTLTVRGERISGLNVSALDAVEFAFSPTPAPTPEPATLLLLGTGILAVLVGRFRPRDQGDQRRI
jgi:hypothetical protein